MGSNKIEVSATGFHVGISVIIDKCDTNPDKDHVRVYKLGGYNNEGKYLLCEFTEGGIGRVYPPLGRASL
jgi:hypothetical protein